MRNLILLTIGFFVAACAALGTTTKIGKSINRETVKVIGFVTTKSTFPDIKINEIADSLFIKSLEIQLTKSTGREIKYLGETEQFLKDTESILAKSYVDAIVQCEIYLVQMLTLDNPKRFNSRVRTQMFKTKDKAFIVETDFNTARGKS